MMSTALGMLDIQQERRLYEFCLELLEELFAVTLSLTDIIC
jgi:hypothetical protein